ncbi:MAG: NAD(P)H-dependent oxidoreductase [Hymenobacteraceae bacterium]|nr:NAD(P)H-dependent oxidoreductase [Hymenobacteraceae bacterium]
MKPIDASAALPPDQRPFRVLIISGSQRRQFNCPGVDSKSRMLMLRLAEQLPTEWEIDYEDLGNVYGRARIQSCNACVSTSMALCVWPCNCYEKNSSAEPDLMWDMDLYARLDMADAWLVIGPINWYAPPSNLKALFDRLVCMNGGNPREDLIDHKDPEKARALEHSAAWKELSINHLEGRTAAFFCYGDDGGEEFGPDGRPKILRHKPYFDPAQEPFDNDREAYAPLVWQCRYGGVEVPDALWQYALFGKDRKYSDAQAEDMVRDQDVMTQFDAWADAVAAFVAQKGQVPPGRFRAYGYEPPTALLGQLKGGWRHARLMAGLPPADSSNAEQQAEGLNQDAPRLFYRQSEGERLRED